MRRYPVYEFRSCSFLYIETRYMLTRRDVDKTVIETRAPYENSSIVFWFVPYLYVSSIASYTLSDCGSLL